MLLAMLLPGCGEGIAVPELMDMARIVRPSTPNTALAAPAGFLPAPDIVTPVYDVPPAALYAAIRHVAAEQPRVTQQIAFDDRLQAHFVSRVLVLGFPDLVTVQAQPAADAGRSTLVVYSRSVYGGFDFGANRARVARWLAALDADLAHGNLSSTGAPS